MAWVKIDDKFPNHPKVASVGPLGMAMQVAALCYCNEYLTDGKIPASVALRLVHLEGLAEPEDVIARLVGAGMWEKADCGYIIHDYHKYQPTKDQVEALQEQRSEAGRKGGQAKAKRAAKQALSKPLSKNSSKKEAKVCPGPVPGPIPEKPPKKDSTRSTSWPEESLPYRLADRLRTCILDRDPSTKVPEVETKQFESWCVEADRMLRIDERDPEETMWLIQWAQNDDFWSANILSMGKFRKQYDKLKRKAQSGAAGNRGQPSRDPPAETPLHRRMRERGKIR